MKPDDPISSVEDADKPRRYRVLENTSADDLRRSPSALINILIVDDEPKNLTVLETVLDSPGYNLIRASSAEQEVSFHYRLAGLYLDRIYGSEGDPRAVLRTAG